LDPGDYAGLCLSGFTRIGDNFNVHFRMEIAPDSPDELARIYARAAVDAFLEEQFRLGDELRAIARPGVTEGPAPNAVAQDETERADARLPDP
jgi:hypothetical protein